MTSQLIPVFAGSIANQTTLLVNARDLHEFLAVGKVFATWITARIEEYGFIENQDFIIFPNSGKNVFSPNSGKTVGRRRKDYHLTLDTAKELAMVERNDKGRQIRRYFIECEKQLMKHAVNPGLAPEPLSHKDMINLKRLVWHMARGMNAGESWTQGMWHCLRSVTGRRSPQPFSVEDLPVLADECRRLLKVTTACNAAVYNFEKDVIRLVVRKRGDIEPLIQQMQSEMLALVEQEQQGMLMLHNFYEKDISALVQRR